MEKYRFFVLLGALSLLLVATPLVREFSSHTTPTISRAIVTCVFIAMLLSAVFAVGRSRMTIKIAILLAGPLVLVEILQLMILSIAVDIPVHLIGIVFLGYVVFVIGQFLFVSDRVTSNTICAAICVYLLLGVLGALVFSAVDILRPGSFTAIEESPPLQEKQISVIRFGGEQSADSLYFSFVTLTTLGYGDITPISPIAKMLVVLEAVIGQLFLAVLIARLIGLHILHSATRNSEDKENF